MGWTVGSEVKLKRGGKGELKREEPTKTGQKHNAVEGGEEEVNQAARSFGYSFSTQEEREEGGRILLGVCPWPWEIGDVNRLGKGEGGNNHFYHVRITLVRGGRCKGGRGRRTSFSPTLYVWVIAWRNNIKFQHTYPGHRTWEEIKITKGCDFQIRRRGREGSWGKARKARGGKENSPFSKSVREGDHRTIFGPSFRESKNQGGGGGKKDGF